MQYRQFLSNPPAIIDPRQRVRYETIHFASQIIHQNYQDIIFEIKNSIKSMTDVLDFQETARVRIFSIVWSLIDQADLIRQAIHTEGDAIQLQSAERFKSIAATVRHLRNWMDHLPARAGHYVQSKENYPPSHGAISFTFVEEQSTIPPGKSVVNFGECDFQTFVIMSTAKQRDLKFEGIPIPFETMKVPIDHLTLQAFGHFLPIEDLVNSVGALCDDLSAGIERFCRDAAARLSSDSGRPMEDFLKGSEMPAGTLVMRAKRNSAS